MSAIPPSTGFLQRAREARPSVRAAFGICCAAPLIVVQLLLAAELPLRYAPSLAAVLLSAWCGGRLAGMATACAAALGIDYLLLAPSFHWSADAPAVVSSVVFVMLAAGVVVGVVTVRRRLDATFTAHQTLDDLARSQAERMTALESEYRSQLSALEGASERAQAHAVSYERIERYVERIELRLAELQAAITEFPVPVALLAEEDGTPVVRASSSALYRLGSADEAAAERAWASAGTLVTVHGDPFGPSEHPLARAARGESVVNEPAGWMTQNGFQRVHLYAKSIVGRRLLAIAVLPISEKTRRTVN